MRRREFITLVGGAAAGFPLTARAQQPAMPILGYLTAGSYDRQRETNLVEVRRGLAETGYVEGRNVTIEYRWAEGRDDRLAEFAADLVRRQVAVIMTSGGTRAALAAKAATKTIAIVFTVGTDPVSAGLVESLNRPGGNLTGFASLITAIVAKRLELLHELVPTATTVALLTNPDNRFLVEAEVSEMQIAARTLGLQVLILNASNPSEFLAAFARLSEVRAGALVVSSDPSLTNQRDLIVALAAHHAVPAIYLFHDYTEVGGLMSYGSNNSESSRVLGVYAGRILKGEKPADLPVQQATRIELVINMKTAKALGLTFPLSLLGRADRVIE
jgi:putative tryptophan/tyrosine transport system substrate-binding protein